MRRKTRKKMKKAVRERGKINITKFLAVYKEGDKVVLKADSSYHKGIYHPRFHGKIATVVGKSGRCYLVRMNDMGKRKVLIVHPAHLVRRASD